MRLFTKLGLMGILVFTVCDVFAHRARFTWRAATGGAAVHS